MPAFYVLRIGKYYHKTLSALVKHVRLGIKLSLIAQALHYKAQHFNFVSCRIADANVV